MFLDITQKRNPELLRVAVDLHQRGLIMPNTYVVDIQTLYSNAVQLVNKAESLDIELYFMTKQIGRNPLISKVIREAGIKKAVAVDPWEALMLAEHGIPIGHVGHLVQIPKHLIKSILELKPDQVTVFSYENAKLVSSVADKLGMKQNILLRVYSEDDYFYPSQEGGINMIDLEEEILKIEKLPGISIKGVTSFPCLNVVDGVARPTENFKTLNKSKIILEAIGIKDVEINAPSVTTTSTLNIIAENGGTQGEPGHALTGTTPLHAKEGNPERPSMIYV